MAMDLLFAAPQNPVGGIYKPYGLVGTTPGEPLTPCNKSRLAPYFPGVNLDKVSVHFGFPTVSKVNDRLASLVGIAVRSGAPAFTDGNDIYFRSLSDYNPDSLGGIELIAHETTHVEQSQRLGYYTQAAQYANEYLQFRTMGLSDRQAYEAISFEREANKKAALIRRDLENLRNQLGGDVFWAPCPPRPQ